MDGKHLAPDDEFGTPGDDHGLGVAVDPTTGAAYVSGEFGGDWSARPGVDPACLHNQGVSDAFVRKYDKDGTFEWQKCFGGSHGDRAYAVYASHRRAYVVGLLVAQYDGQSAPSVDGFVREYDDAGNLLGSYPLYGKDGRPTVGFQVTGDGGGVYVIGSSASETIAPDPRGGMDAVLWKFLPPGEDPGDPSPALVPYWQHPLRFGGPENEYGYGVSVSGDLVFVGGFTAGEIAGQPFCGGGFDSWTAAVTTAGRTRWIRRFGSPGDDYVYRLTSNALGAFVVGGTDGALPGQSNQGSLDAMVVGYDRRGKFLGSMQLGTPADEEAYGVAADGNTLYIAGYTEGDFFSPPGDDDLWVGALASDRLTRGAPGCRR